eukprot:CAMPEP_0180711610 /NCGR_PEP_ID=MMETSP1038_2-20121128/10942_1 /TAXON_ID=632150 /ORGANISM="Azadinium spinosum, Strain 3D9" /LENGTH=230 /DNA_ID=CAMNT_0022743843 /DNA_START=141 /DNA_END=830 /DNA_ORIENTATION=+
MKDHFFLPGDYCCRVRENAKGMFFVSRGMCSVLDRDLETVKKALVIGDSFGEMNLMCGHPFLVYVRADSYCICAVLEKVQFLQLVKQFPKVAERLVKRMTQGERDLMKGRAGFTAAARRRSSAILSHRTSVRMSVCSSDSGMPTEGGLLGQEPRQSFSAARQSAKFSSRGDFMQAMESIKQNARAEREEIEALKKESQAIDTEDEADGNDKKDDIDGTENTREKARSQEE